MARIRMIKVRGRKGNKPKVVYMHNKNFDTYTTRKNGKYNVAIVTNYQKDKFINNQIRAFSGKIRFHTVRA